MRPLFLLLLLFFSLTTFGQTVTDHLKKGSHKQEKKVYKEALEEYNKAIQLDSSLPEAYYERASLLFEMGKHQEAIRDLDKSISLKPDLTKAILLRGKSFVKTENKEKACEDFLKARQLGDSIAKRYIQQYFCEYKLEKGESIVLDWPESENWKITYQSSEGNQNIYLLGRSNETKKNWTELAGMSSMMGLNKVDMNVAMNDFFEQAKGESPKAKLTFLEKDLLSKYPWIMYTIESVYNEECTCNESQLWYLIQGQQALYSCFRSVRGDKLTKEQLDRFKKFFKAGEIVYQ